MYLGTMARTFPEKPALICGDAVLSYAELEARSNQLAHLFHAWGLREGDGIAVVLGNEIRFAEFYWAALRTGLYFTPINTHLAPAEMHYIIDNCEARLLVVSQTFRDVVAPFASQLPQVTHRLIVDGMLQGFEPYPQSASSWPTTPLAQEREGATMLYSSGTTGRPKGIRRGLPGRHPADAPAAALGAALRFGFQADDRYLCVGPLYHAAPLGFSFAMHRIGATVVLMPRFEAEGALAHIARHRVTTSQWVPTHFVRLLQLPATVRQRYDLTSHRLAIHAAAPCPVDIKRQMIDWWGEIIVEYYAATEGGGTMVDTAAWLQRPGTVGRHWTGGKVWILDEAGQELPAGQPGLIYFAAPEAARERFHYYKDASKTASAYREDRFTIGDIGYLDSEGYLFLTDRQSHLIISGGVNIYPAEVESTLIGHAAIRDVAVIGVPDADMGEQVKAVAELRDGYTATPELAREIIDFTRDRIAHYKCPKSVDFVAQLPRSAAGKLLKQALRAGYWPQGGPGER